MEALRRVKAITRIVVGLLVAWTGISEGVDGTQAVLELTEDSKRSMRLASEGEPHYEIFQRWTWPEKLNRWPPAINVDVLLSIHSFMTAENLRHNKAPKLSIAGAKDRGGYMICSVLFRTFERDRIHDHHLRLAEMMKARGDVPC